MEKTGPAIGLIRNAQFKSEVIKINQGDLLLLYTDGLVESRNGNSEEFGEDRLASFLTANHHKSANDFVKDLRDDAANFAKKFQDDLSLIAVKF